AIFRNRHDDRDGLPAAEDNSLLATFGGVENLPEITLRIDNRHSPHDMSSPGPNVTLSISFYYRRGHTAAHGIDTRASARLQAVERHGVVAEDLVDHARVDVAFLAHDAPRPAPAR